LALTVLWLFGLAFLLPSAAAANLADDIADILTAKVAQRAFWGIKVVDLETGEGVYEQNAEKLFMPASNTKLFSTALGLFRLGPEYLYTTSIVSEGSSLDGVLTGDLIILGGGDPNLSARIIPYDPEDEFSKDLLLPIKELATQIVDSGISKIDGDIVGDDTRYVWQKYPPGWSIDDATWGYGAPVSALSFNDNLVKLRVLPALMSHSLARVSFKPDIPYLSLDNRLRTAPTRTVAKGLNLGRDPGSRKLNLWGDISIRSRGRTLSIAVDDPALFTAVALQHELESKGVEVTGVPAARHAPPHEFASLKRVPEPKVKTYTTKLAELQSAALIESLRIINKESLNLHAEMLLREVALRQRGVGSIEAGLLELKDFLKEAGLRSDEFQLNDASGLSRKNLVSPEAAVKLLSYIWNSPHRDDFVSTLPLAGEDGTLDWRFSKTSARGLIRAKTGTLAHVTAISGYATTQDGRRLAFSVMANNYGVQTSYVRSLVDKICVALIWPLPEPVEGSGIESDTAEGSSTPVPPRPASP
jgi:D-alanyl-D-alanine carboxypeptidase/D-alanyl-D-alanine-endopeptidase (penicillin-binding protein 4)